LPLESVPLRVLLLRPPEPLLLLPFGCLHLISDMRGSISIQEGARYIMSRQVLQPHAKRPKIVGGFVRGNVQEPTLSRRGRKMMPRSTARGICGFGVNCFIFYGERGRNRTYNLLIKSRRNGEIQECSRLLASTLSDCSSVGLAIRR